MLQFRALTLVLLIAFSDFGLSAESTRDIEGPEIVEISAADREALLAAPRVLVRPQPSVWLYAAFHAGTVDSFKVEKFIENFNSAAEGGTGRNPLTTHLGWIRYAPVVQTDSRMHQPVVMCVSQGAEIRWIHCQDESWVWLQTADMANAIRFNGELGIVRSAQTFDLEDDHIAPIFDLIDNAALISKSTDQLVTSDDVCQITNNSIPRSIWIDVHVNSSEEGCRIDVFALTPMDVIKLTQTTDPAGQSRFEISEIQWAQE